MSDCDSNSPIDLSRCSDSVETSKTPSPYNTSSFTETSPSLGNDSPSSLHFRKSSLLRSDTPTHRYHPSAFKPINNTKQERISQPTLDSIRVHHQYQWLQDPNHTEKNSYYLNALHAQQKYSKSPMESGPSSPETDAPISLPYSTELRNQDGKSTRPFKMYSKDSLDSSAAMPSSMDPFQLFRQQALDQLYASGDLTNPKKRPLSQKSYDGSEEQSEMDYHGQNDGENKSDSSSSNGKGIVKDEAYYDRRRKNNVAAKKSRDRRRLKESELVIRAAFLQRENYQLRCELDAAKRQLERFIAV